MSKKTPQKKKSKAASAPAERWSARQKRRLKRLMWRSMIWVVSLTIFAVLIFTVVNPPFTLTMFAEKQRLGQVDYQWTPIESVAPVMARSVVAAEDANFCEHWGFDLGAIRAAIDEGGSRGASTISQQVVKNVYLWQGRSWVRKAMETAITPLVEMAWSKQRIVEVYLNIAEFDEGVFGIEAASRHYFGVGPEGLSASQAARLAMVLPSPKTRSASRITAAQSRRVSSIMDGAATIARDGRAACFE